jgi:hypothetical protein
LQHDKAVRLVYWIAIVFMAGVLTVCWFDVGPSHPVFAALLVSWTLILGPGLVGPSIRLLPPGWCRVPARERLLHRILGVWIFAWLLESSGWNRHNVYRVWGFSITRSRVPFRALAARAGGGAHGACFAIHAVLSAAALLSGRPWGALWILAPGVVVHLYPVLLQRSIMLRLQPLLDKSGTQRITIAEQAAAGDARNART